MFVFCQFQVVVEDGGEPPRSDIAPVTIEILRNFNRPVFTAAQFNTTILETQSMGTTITIVTATDADDKVVSCN